MRMESIKLELKVTPLCSCQIRVSFLQHSLQITELARWRFYLRRRCHALLSKFHQQCTSAYDAKYDLAVENRAWWFFGFLAPCSEQAGYKRVSRTISQKLTGRCSLTGRFQELFVGMQHIDWIIKGRRKFKKNKQTHEQNCKEKASS